MKQLFLKPLAFCLFLLFFTGCTSDVVVENNRSQSDNTHIVTFSGGAVSTRTSITHIPGNGGVAFWSTGDKIWVKDKSNIFQQSSEGIFNDSKTKGTFSISTGLFDDGCQVNYTGNSVSGEQVTIASSQTQNVVNDFSHAGESGDCGVATAHGNGDSFNFKLEHKAAYLCFMPYCTNTYLGPNIYLTKITVIADKPIAGQYDFTDGTLVNKTPSTATASKTITLTTNNFAMNTTIANVTLNGAYMVIAPGKYNLTISYTIKDPITNVEGDITKTFNDVDCAPGVFQDFSANLTPTDYSGKQYYMWNAKQNYWAGHEWDSADPWQPTLANSENASKAPTASDGLRWYNNGVNKGSYIEPDNESFKNVPNRNEISHYIGKLVPDNPSDPWGALHADGILWDPNTLWSTMGHLYKNGAWLKKRVNISDFSSIQVNGMDMRTSMSGTSMMPILSVRPTDISKYFFLPALGYYYGGKLYGIGAFCSYWCFDQPGMNHQYSLMISSGFPTGYVVNFVGTSGPEQGCVAMKFE